MLGTTDVVSHWKRVWPSPFAVPWASQLTQQTERLREGAALALHGKAG